jgi:uncharacterized membrane protein
MILKLFVVLLSLLVLDALYISPQFTSFKQIYKKIQGSPLVIKPLGVILCYVFLVAELYYFILMKKRPVLDAFILGVCTYGVYNTTTYALLTDFPLRIVFTDTLWGGVLFGATTWIYYKLKLA